MTLTARLREGTRMLHAEAERAGLMPRLLRGELPLPGYVALLHQLHAIYAALETALQGRPGAPVLHPALARCAALQADLDHLDPQGRPVLLAPTRDYVACLQALPGGLLAAHAYVRYLGDLAGGQVLRRIVGRTYGLSEHGLRFYDFGADGAALGQGLRATLDAVPAGQHDGIVAEAQAAFRRHVLLFESLAQGLV
jgi:heme oxygenase